MSMFYSKKVLTILILSCMIFSEREERLQMLRSVMVIASSPCPVDTLRTCVAWNRGGPPTKPEGTISHPSSRLVVTVGRCGWQLCIPRFKSKGATLYGPRQQSTSNDTTGS